MCKECGVPVRIGRDHSWNPDGTITQRRDPDHQMVLFDADGIDSLFANIEKLIGMSIGKLVIESKARATQAYVSHLLRGLRGTVARLIGVDRIVGRVIDQGRVMGYGDITAELIDWDNKLMKIKAVSPYSLKLFCGDMRGATEAIRNIEGTVTYEEAGPDTYRITATHEPHAPELQNRLVPERPPRKPGNISYELCPECKVPARLSEFRWDTSAGTIHHAPTGMRYALFGPAGLVAVFDELESELGETIPETIVEAQRLHAESMMKNNWGSMGTVDLASGLPGLRQWLQGWLGMQGMGNLTSLEESGGAFTARIENPATPLVLVGTSAALFEFLSGAGSSVDWSIAADGDLTFTITPAGS